MRLFTRTMVAADAGLNSRSGDCGPSDSFADLYRDLVNRYLQEISRAFIIPAAGKPETEEKEETLANRLRQSYRIQETSNQ